MEVAYKKRGSEMEEDTLRSEEPLLNLYAKDTTAGAIQSTEEMRSREEVVHGAE